MHAMAVIGDVSLYYRCNCAGNAKLSRYAREQRFIACATGARPRCMGIDFGYGRALDRQQRIDPAVPLSNTASPMADPRPTPANHRWNAMTGLAENARLPPWPPPMHGSEARFSAGAPLLPLLCSQPRHRLRIFPPARLVWPAILA
jgi:hypothetical protein